ncbi:Crp/Fnr family transcriptional regulator [Hydrogenimonas thermophila]|uniref:Crp/Fnr family transcriptional regulator n=1 Tax=Hydrogenimonas thermophila TaxID=223786 RepID=UPI0029371811|nr:Crp/Fnr family transcriptional regulator [Hydrogenimonas thermophila]WOE70059.1 Crp/Fnr family transcriptional regulator [Hydrogenimonas thermophila]WOE72576.1 Crp/Fnr family transcriptional regulator [Hydrogenimonas thermophila]
MSSNIPLIKGILKDFFLFSHLDEEKLNSLVSISSLVEYKKESILFFEGEEPKSLIILIDGILKVYKTDLKGNKVILHRFYPVDLIAELVNIEHMNYPASGEFETDGKAILINYKEFEKKFLKDPEVSFAFIKSLSKKIKYLENVIATNLVMNSTARVAKFICEHGHEISKLKKSMIAADLNMAPETLSRILKKLSTLKLIEREKDEIIILDKEGLTTFYL